MPVRCAAEMSGEAVPEAVLTFWGELELESDLELESHVHLGSREEQEARVTEVVRLGVPGWQG